jgi:hypothetical protein
MQILLLFEICRSNRPKQSIKATHILILTESNVPRSELLHLLVHALDLLVLRPG